MKCCSVLLAVFALVIVVGCDSGTSLPGRDSNSISDVVQPDDASTGTDSGNDLEVSRDVPVDQPDAQSIDQGCIDCDSTVGDAGDVVLVDVPSNCPGGFLCPCESGDDCLSDKCVQDVGGMVCSRNCATSDSCPADWRCSQVAGSGGDTAWVCVNPFTTLCRPCKADLECRPGEGGGADSFACLARGEVGSFCGKSCQTEKDCPRTYVCEDTAISGGTAKFCIPSEGAACPCLPYFVTEGFLTTCSVTNGVGTCMADRTCDQECTAQ
jgi:hypothetical protein